MTTNPLEASEARPPDFDERTLRSLLTEVYGMSGRLTPLLGERDQNTRVDLDTGQCFVLKIAGVVEDPVVTDCQVQVLLHLEENGCPVAVPRVRRTVAGEPSTEILRGSDRHIARLVTYVPGVQMSEVSLSADIAWSFGRKLAQLGESLRGFRHAGDHQVLPWDMQRLLQLRPILHHIDDTEVQQLASAVMGDFEKRVLPAFSGLRKQLIHSDANPENVLLDTDENGVTGFIDFGDMLRAPLVVDVAVAASYLRAFEGDALQFILPFVAGYHSVTNLDAPEIELLFDLIRARLVTSLSMLHWRLSVRSEDDAYRQSTLSQESGAQVFLARLDDVGRKAFDQALREAV